MASVHHECPKCGRPMQPGFLLDTQHGWHGQTDWVGGLPKRSIWTGVKLKGRQRLPVTVYRCERCGFLESYAVQQP